MRRWAHVQLPVKNDAEYLPLDAGCKRSNHHSRDGCSVFFCLVEDRLESRGRKGFIAYASLACEGTFGLCGRKSLLSRHPGQKKVARGVIQFVVLARGGKE